MERNKEEVIPKQTQPEPIEENKRTFLIYVTNGELMEKVFVRTTNIVEAMALFLERYQEMCFDWSTINLAVEEIETLE